MPGMRASASSRSSRLAPLALASRQELIELENHVLGLAKHEGVDERRERLGDKRAGAAGEHDRVVLAARLGANRDAGEVEHLEDVGVGQLVGEREAERVEFAERAAVLKAEERRAVAP